MKKSLLLYPIIVGALVCFIGLTLHIGKDWHTNPKSNPANQSSDQALFNQQHINDLSPYQIIADQLLSQLNSPFVILLLQILAILIISKLFGFIIKKLGQPSVIGEMIAGIFLGPSLIGYYFPDIFNFLFPKNSFSNLQFLSQVGLVFFMFIIGMELDFDHLKSKAKNALLISHVSIFFPFLLGICMSFILFKEFAPTDVNFTSFALFMGISISITAFPILARILHERKLTKTPLGDLAITCAAIDDVTAWCILATVIAIVRSSGLESALFTFTVSILFFMIMFYLIRPWIKKINSRENFDLNHNKYSVIVVFIVLIFSASFTEIIGIHAFFGAFVAGTIMPHHLNIKTLHLEKLEDVSTLVLLPIFFAFTGLRTQINLLNDGHLWITCGWIILVAVMGKFGGSTLISKITGHPWKVALSIGALMNTRGLMELIVLNIGYDLGILSPTLFTIMVIMALFTTMMTGPLLNLINYLFAKKSLL